MGLTLRETPLDPRLTRCEPLGYRLFSNTKRKNTPLSLLMLSQPFCVCVSVRTPVSGDRCRRNKLRRQIDGRNATDASAHTTSRPYSHHQLYDGGYEYARLGLPPYLMVTPHPFLADFLHWRTRRTHRSNTLIRACGHTAHALRPVHASF